VRVSRHWCPAGLARAGRLPCGRASLALPPPGWMRRKSSRVTWCPCERGCAGPRGTGKPLQIAVDDAKGTTEVTQDPPAPASTALVAAAIALLTFVRARFRTGVVQWLCTKALVFVPVIWRATGASERAASALPRCSALGPTCSMAFGLVRAGHRPESDGIGASGLGVSSIL